MTKATFAFLAALTLAGSSLMAQSWPAIKVTVPFDFVAGAKAYPAGVYDFHTNPLGGVVTISGTDSKAYQSLLAKPTESTKTSHLMAIRFNRYGDRYFLFQIWTGGGLGQEVPKSRAEREQIAASGRSPVIASLTAKP